MIAMSSVELLRNQSKPKVRSKRMRLLLVEDNQRLAEHVGQALKSAGFVVDHVGCSGDADVSLRATPYDIVLLDLGLPDEDGITLLTRIRQRDRNIPVLVLTARDGTQSLVEGLNKGADDYLRKPFENDELIARVRALLRRPGSALGHILEEGNVSLDTGARQVMADGKVLELGRREIDALELLMRRVGRVVSKAAIEQAIYGHDDEIASNAIEVLIHRLRKRLTDGGARLSIHTVRGVGYILAGEPA